MTYRRIALADPANPLDDDYNADGLTGDRAAYITWAASVKSAGGTVTNYPDHLTVTGIGDVYGLPAAQYHFDVLYLPPDYARNPKFLTDPTTFTADSAYGYYPAPFAVLQWVKNGGLTAPTPGEIPTGPTWYKDLLTGLKYAAIAGVAVVAVSFMRRRS